MSAGISFDPAEHPHRRRNLLTGEWLLVLPHRARRPWRGEVAPPAPTAAPAYDPHCYLCPGNARASGAHNPTYSGPFVFANDFAALMPDTPAPPSDLLRPAAAASGEARVICFSSDHRLTLPELSDDERRAIVDVCAAQSAELGRRWTHVQLFENKGAMMGCSSPHPHGQVWASDFVPDHVAREHERQRAWRAEHGTTLLDAVVAAEAGGPRAVEDDEHWLAIVPWWAAWPFETLIVARDPVARMEDLEGPARDALARLLGRLMARYDNLFGVSFPYSFGWHGCPHGIADVIGWRLHAHTYPPLLRSATVRKFMVGFEMLGEPQRDLTPEQAAERQCQGNGRPGAAGGAALIGVDLAIVGDIPRGAGLSSSASLEVAIGHAMLVAARLPAPAADVAVMAQRAENEFVGMKCGIMDQLASAAGVAGAALLIDCRSLACRPVAMPADAGILIVHSGAVRGLVEGHYNRRRAECEEAAAALGLAKLRDADPLAIERAAIAELPRRRARHVVAENARVLAMADRLAADDLVGAGRLMAESHASMRDDFALTVPAIDRLAEVAQAAIARLAVGEGGARMTGGGFGGAVVVLVRRSRAQAVMRAIREEYRTPDGTDPFIMVETASAGAGPVAA